MKAAGEGEGLGWVMKQGSTGLAAMLEMLGISRFKAVPALVSVSVKYIYLLTLERGGFSH